MCNPCSGRHCSGQPKTEWDYEGGAGFISRPHDQGETFTHWNVVPAHGLTELLPRELRRRSRPNDKP